MPTDDHHHPFCAAAIATFDAPPALKNGSGHKNDLAEVFGKFKCAPQVVFVRPGRGYGDLLQRKTSKLNTMARATRLITGSNDYFPDHGHNMRNMVWIRCMAVCLARAVVLTAKTEPEQIREVTEAIVILDRKTMTKPSRQLFTDRVCSLAEDISSPRNAVVSDKSSADIRELIRFGRDDVSVFWSDEIPPSESQDGLFLAHRLSGLANTALSSATEAHLAQDLSMEFADLFYDATPDVVRPISKTAVDRWKKRTGLPEPLE